MLCLAQKTNENESKPLKRPSEESLSFFYSINFPRLIMLTLHFPAGSREKECGNRAGAVERTDAKQTSPIVLGEER